ncbi:MAG: hypothetical protein QF405_12520 [Roseibacillus sp.]|jgi:hypothetical protein|nr:hypothetical protein [Roseibacillus sp.]MDP7657425.1 hypothetical protein [Roseibacillus sp.]
MQTSLFRSLAALLLLAWMATPAPADDKEEDAAEEKKGEATEEKSDPAEFRTFTSTRGDKTLKLKVVARIDDETYKVENPEGKVFNIKTANLSHSDQRFLDFWEPDAILNLQTAKLPKVLEQMGYSTLDLTVVESTFFVNVTVDGKSGKFLLDPNRGWSTFDPAAAKEIGMNLGQGRINFTDNTGKTSRSKRGAVKEFKAGQVTITAHEFEVIEVAKMFRAVPANTIGAIGGDLLKRLNALIDFGGKRLFVRKGQ